MFKFCLRVIKKNTNFILFILLIVLIIITLIFNEEIFSEKIFNIETLELEYHPCPSKVTVKQSTNPKKKFKAHYKTQDGLFQSSINNKCSLPKQSSLDSKLAEKSKIMNN